MTQKIIKEVLDDVGRGFKTTANPGEVFVVFDGRKDPVVLGVGERLTPGERFRRGGRKIVRVDMTERVSEMAETVVASDGARRFDVQFTLTWKVEKPIVAAEQGEIDVDANVRQRARAVLAGLDRRFVMDSGGASGLFEALRTALNGLPVEFVTIIGIVGRTNLDELGLKKEGERSDLTLTNELDKIRRDAAVAAERSTLMVASELDEMRRKAAVEAEKHSITIQAMKEAEELRISKIRADHDVEIMKHRIGVFREAAGDFQGLIAIQLANDPSKVDVTIRNALDQQQMTAQFDLETLKVLLAADAFEGAQASKHGAEVLKVIVDKVKSGGAWQPWTPIAPGVAGSLPSTTVPDAAAAQSPASGSTPPAGASDDEEDDE